MKTTGTTSYKIYAIFLVLGLIWILLSDLILLTIFNLQDKPLLVNVIKATVFIIFTILLIVALQKSYTAQLSQQSAINKEIEDKYKIMFKCNPIPMWIYDLDTWNFLLVNKAAIQHYGYSEEEFLSMTLLDIRPSEDHDKLRENFSQDVKDGHSFSGTWKHIKKDGELLFVEIESHPIVYQGRRGKLVLASNITQRIKTENEIKVVVSELNDFVYRASHDIRGPLARLIGLSNLLLIEGNLENRVKYDNLINSTAILLDNVLQRLLSVNNLKYYEPQSEQINLHDLIDEIVGLVKKGNRKDIAVYNDIPDSLEVKTDRKMVMLALENLIENGIKYADFNNYKKPYVKINTVTQQGQLHIQVIDNGIGIHDVFKHRIFDIFFRGTELSQGSGLGLYIAQTALGKLNGRLDYKSDIKEETVFDICIPT